MATEAEQRFSECSQETQLIVARWMRDLAFTAPEAHEWRWSLIAQELDGLLADRDGDEEDYDSL